VTSSFTELGLAEPLLRAIQAENYDTPTPIQAQAIPYLLEGKDLLGIAQTGTGKTAAFALPILQRLSAVEVQRRRGAVRALILTPTRELAVQISESFRSYGRHLGLRSAVIFGGVNQYAQVQALARGVDILVATPGRLLDLMNQRHVDLRDLSIFVLDEADRMLDMGFIHDVKRVVAVLPKQRQTLFFSATMPGEIEKLAAGILTDPVHITVTPPSTTVERIDQRVYFVAASHKSSLLAEVLKDETVARVLVFTRTKHGADRVTQHVQRIGIEAQAIHGNKSQSARQRALKDFRDGQTRVLVATDIAARGIDIDGITHVINYEIPNVPETYVHRIGRTARAGRDGIALTFCDSSERSLLRDVERLTRHPLSIVDNHGFHAVSGTSDAPQSRNGGQRSNGQRSGGPRGNSPRPHRQGQGGQGQGSGGQGSGGQRSGGQRSNEQRQGAQRQGEHRPSENRSADFRQTDYRQTDYRQGDYRQTAAQEPSRDRNGPRQPRPNQGRADDSRPPQDRAYQGRPKQGHSRQDRPDQGQANRVQPDQGRPHGQRRRPHKQAQA
jgi:ATP-dependent RNA helicase RhlE